jgi:hypothetical protein
MKFSLLWGRLSGILLRFDFALSDFGDLATVAILANLGFVIAGLRNTSHEAPLLPNTLNQIQPLPGQDTPKRTLPRMLEEMLGIAFAAFCGLTLRMFLHKWYCLDELCSNLEDGGQIIDTVTVVVVFLVLALTIGLIENRRARR